MPPKLVAHAVGANTSANQQLNLTKHSCNAGRQALAGEGEGPGGHRHVQHRVRHEASRPPRGRRQAGQLQNQLQVRGRSDLDTVVFMPGPSQHACVQHAFA